MKLEYYPEEKLKKEILEIIKKYLDLKDYKVFLFGSRVRGDSFPRSDIDIGILGKKPVPPQIMFKIKEEIEELPTLYKFDLIDFFDVSEDFKKEALKYVEELQ